MKEVKGLNPKTGDAETRQLVIEENLAGLAFKIQNDPHVGKLTFFKFIPEKK